MSFEVRQASRASVKPLVGFYGKSGSGKTMSALLFARGLVGEKGRVCLVDSESGRGSIFADLIPGGYSIVDLEPPFSPERYLGAFEAAEKAADCIVVDSLSHEWFSEGGILDMQDEELTRMAGDDWKKREACKMAAWIRPKMMHKRFIGALLRCRLPLICCLRGEEKTHFDKGADGKRTVTTDSFCTPIQDPRLIFEFLLNLETYARDGKGGYVVPRKITHPQIAPLLPKDNEQITIAHGQALARWCAGGSLSAVPPVAAPLSLPPATAGPQSSKAKLTPEQLRERWVKRCIEAGGGRPDYAVELFVETGTILDTERLEDFPLAKLPKTKEEAENLLSEIRTRAGLADVPTP